MPEIICYGHNFSRTEAKGFSDLETVCDTMQPQANMGFIPQIIYEIIAPGHDFSRTETKGQGHIDPETVMTHSESPRSIYTPNLGFICGGLPGGGGGGSVLP